MTRAALRIVVPAASALVVLVASPAPAPAADKKPAKLVDAYFKAKKAADRAAAWAAIEAAPPLAADEVEKLAAAVLKHLKKRGRKIKKGRNEWFDEKEDGWKGLFLTSGKGKKGLVLALHGGGAGAGDAGSAASSFSGPIGSLGYRGIYPEVLKKTEYGWTDPPATERWVMELLRAARRTWDVDPNRVYVTGHSMGGYGTWTYGSIYADQFAGGAAFAGAPTVYWEPGGKDRSAEAVVEGYLPNLYNLPLFVYQSLDDPNVPAAANVFACAELARLHEGDPGGWKHVYEQVDGRGHAFPEKGPTPGLEWMASHERDPRPAKIVWQPTREWKKTFYWLRWERPWLGSLVTASVDTAQNSIDVVVERPRSATPQRTEAQREEFVGTLSFYLDGRLVDLAQEVVITVDGVERFRGVPPLRLATLVRSIEVREDAEYAFAVEVSLDPLPAGSRRGE